MKNRTVRAILLFMCFLLVMTYVLCSCEKENDYAPYGNSVGVYKEHSEADRETQDDSNEQAYTMRVALTLDDGPHITRTRAIVDALDKYGYNATFFVVGNRVDGTVYSGADAMVYAYNHGNEIAIHAYTHEYYYNECTDEQFSDELLLTKRAINKYLPNVKVKLMRPVGGAITASRVQSCGYSTIIWNVDSEDWRYSKRSTEEEQKQNVDIIVENVMSCVKDGDIILMHDIHENTAVAIPIILEKLHAAGYDVVTVSELLGDSVEAGKKFSHG